jgi:transcription-repair coupling factor (superfamily II helicase)
MIKLFIDISSVFVRHSAWQNVLSVVANNKIGTYLTGLAGASDSVLLASLFTEQKRYILQVSDNELEAERIYDDIVKLIGEEHVVLVGSGHKDSVIKQALYKHHTDTDIHAQILEALERISTSTEPLLIITTAETFALPIPTKEQVAKNLLTVRRGEDIDFQTFIGWLKTSHFDEKKFVEVCGDFAVRGGIIDVFPYTETVPFRIEFMGDTVESIREFDAVSQRSIAHREELHLVGDILQEESIEKMSLLTDHITEGALYVISQPELVIKQCEELNATRAIEVIREKAHLLLSQFAPPGAEVIDFGFKKQPSFNSNLKFIKEYLKNLIHSKWHIYVLAESRDLLERLEDLTNADEEIGSVSEEVLDDLAIDPITPSVSYIKYEVPSLSAGFIFPDEYRVAVLAEHELFGRRRGAGASRRKKSSRTKGISLRELRSLKRGDLLVHEDKGIGKFMGLETIEVRGAMQEVVRLIYRDNDVLFVNLDYISKLSKYSAAEVDETSIKLSKLGSAEWQRAKERTKKRLKDIARDLIKLYAKRKTQEGFAFSPDDLMQREMEASFLYEDTPDQAKATLEFKVDMESNAPMDRLICGDVGYGKTEVAMRAAMKAVIDKKQVAVLVPTTILAEQHARSFSDRLEQFGVRVACISRFRSTKEQKEITVALAEGKIDVLIGTHRMLSQDVVFKDLGLLIIDEEHRFGVAAKEKLRALRTNIDTLTLTATPIPRTLNFSLLGARDLSVIETPPKNRLPIMTEILVGVDEGILAKAISRELERGGQIYAINDKVKDIEVFADKLREIAPRARRGIIHGQMSPTQIEKVMRDFLERKIDILCATKIVESGLDVPNANTIIINRSQNFGLAELYQLRGRVGRSNEQAYCYLITNPIKTLSTDSLKRLEAMEEFSDLGAGFQLAMRDLEIRGAGNLLGGEQSGFINEIGFDLYQKTLAEAVDELKEEEFKDLFKNLPQTTKARNAFIRRRADDSDEVTISLGLDALIPERYIEDDAERFGFYQKLNQLATTDELAELRSELADRFGALPEEVQTLFGAAHIRMLARRLGVRGVSVDEVTRTLRLTLPKEDQSEYYQGFFPKLIDKFPVIGESKVRLVNDKKAMRLVIKLASLDEATRIDEIVTILTTLTPVDTAIAA